MKFYLLLAVCACVSTLSAAVSDWMPSDAASHEEWMPLASDAVKAGGVFGERIAKTVTNNILKVDVDAVFLKPFVEKKSGEGTYLAVGKFTEACVLFAKHTGDKRVLELKNHLIDVLIAHQSSDGYIGTIGNPQIRLSAAWDAHECAYIQTALITDYELFGSEKSLAAARKTADWVLANWHTLPEGWGKTWCSEPMYTIGQCRAMMRLYAATRDARYLEFCRRMRRLADFDYPIVLGRDMLVWGHIYTYMEWCLAQHALYRETHDPKLFRQTAKAFDFLFDGDGALVTGHSGICECWSDAQDGDGDVGETCATVYQLFDYDSALRLGAGDPVRLGDAMERTIYNGLFAAQSPDGRKARYYTPLLGERKYYAGDVYCCPNNIRRGIARLPEWIFYTKRDALLVNLFTPCTATARVAGTEVVLEEKTDYPSSGRITLAVSPAKPASFSVYLRIPKWCTSPSVKIAGESVREPVVPGRLLRLVRTWKKGDTLELDFPMEVRTIRGRKRQAGRFAVLRGPLVYALAPKKADLGPDPEKKEVRACFDTHPFDIQKTMIVDPKSIRLAEKGEDAFRAGATLLEAHVNVEPFAVGVYFWGPHQRVYLREYADPDCTVTYFRCPDPAAVASDDEIFR